MGLQHGSHGVNNRQEIQVQGNTAAEAARPVASRRAGSPPGSPASALGVVRHPPSNGVLGGVPGEQLRGVVVKGAVHEGGLRS
jgi:hypothetical protein